MWNPKLSLFLLYSTNNMMELYFVEGTKMEFLRKSKKMYLFIRFHLSFMLL